LARTGTGYEWNFQVADYNGDSAPDLYAINRAGASGRVEVHVMSGATTFQSFLLNAATPLAQVPSTNAYEFELGDYDRDGRVDLYYIPLRGGSGRVEVHVLSAASTFQTFIANAATSLTISSTQTVWDFELGPIY
jgi:hypothetical protein